MFIYIWFTYFLKKFILLLAEFTQHDINHGQLWYIHNGSSAITLDKFIDGVLLDYMVFDVENGIQTLCDLQFNFDIIPKKIPLR